MKITSKQIILIILVCLFALSALGGYFLCWPKYKEFQTKKSEIEIKDEEIRLKEEYLSILKTFSERLLKYSEQLSKIDSAFPVNPSPALMFNFFQKASSENGLILTETNTSTEQSPEGRIQETSFSISVSGSYSAFKNFLSTIYASSRIIEVKSINFSSEEEGRDLFNFNLELKTQSYAY